MWKKIGVAFGVLLAVLLITVAVQPSDFRIERSITVNAPPGVPFSLVNDFRKWGLWSPWDRIDPDMKREYSGAETGVGAQYAWIGNDEVGEGRMTIERSTADRAIEIRLEFLKPFATTNQTVFSFTTAGTGTKVNWAMTGQNNFFGKAFTLFMDMDKMVGDDFDKGLTKLKELSEKGTP